MGKGTGKDKEDSKKTRTSNDFFGPAQAGPGRGALVNTTTSSTATGPGLPRQVPKKVLHRCASDLLLLSGLHPPPGQPRRHPRRRKQRFLPLTAWPLLHFCKLVKNNSLYYQEAVWYPSADVHLLRRRVDSLERELSQLTRAFATKDDVRNLRDGVDIPLSQLSKAVRRFDRKEEYLHLSSEERFALLDARLEKAQRDAATNAQLIDQLREEHQRFSNPITPLLHVIGAVLGHHYGGKDHQRELRWFERGPFWLLLWPVNVSTLAIEWVSKSNLAVEDSPSHSTPGKVTMIS